MRLSQSEMACLGPRSCVWRTSHIIAVAISFATAASLVPSMDGSATSCRRCSSNHTGNHPSRCNRPNQMQGLHRAGVAVSQVLRGGWRAVSDALRLREGQTVCLTALSPGVIRVSPNSVRRLLINIVPVQHRHLHGSERPSVTSSQPARVRPGPEALHAA